MEEKEWEVAPFSMVNQDPEEALAKDPQMQALFHQLGYLDRCCRVSLKPQTASRIFLGEWCKKLIVKLSFFLVAPLVRQQNEANLQAASCMRALLKQVDQLTERVSELEEERDVLRALCGKPQKPDGQTQATDAGAEGGGS